MENYYYFKLKKMSRRKKQWGNRQLKE